jgi:hypothetical protein
MASWLAGSKGGVTNFASGQRVATVVATPTAQTTKEATQANNRSVGALNKRNIFTVTFTYQQIKKT